jgi:16S rRNA (guanine(966)-N(2))-methyltransferase RsmD
MRIISGRLKGFVFKVPKGIRPTEQKVSKSLFDILTPDIQDVKFLELYAGSGNIGIEAFSRGAKQVVMVEQNGQNTSVINENIALILNRFSFVDPSSIQVLTLDAESAIKKFSARQEKFEIVFLDPPYYKELAKKTLQTLDQYDIVAPNGLVVAQAHRKDSMPDLKNLRLYRKEYYSDTALYFLLKKS